MKVRPYAKRIVGLTGTPSSNGLMDLWAEFRVLDLGKRLGRYITHYRDAYFKPDKRNGAVIFSYKPVPGAEEAIYEKISDITISMKSCDYLTLPECVMNEVPVWITEMSLPFAYDHFAEGEVPDVPYLLYLNPANNNFAADGSAYYKVNEIHIELYTDHKDLSAEQTVEAVLDRHGIFYTKSETWIESEKLYDVLFIFDMEA